METGNQILIVTAISWNISDTDLIPQTVVIGCTNIPKHKCCFPAMCLQVQECKMGCVAHSRSARKDVGACRTQCVSRYSESLVGNKLALSEIYTHVPILCMKVEMIIHCMY